MAFLNKIWKTSLGVWGNGANPFFADYLSGYGLQRLISTGSVPAFESKMDTTTANAFAAPESATVPFDLSAYQDGRHLYWAQDSAGKVAFAWISGTAPGGETLDSELITGGSAWAGASGATPPTGWSAQNAGLFDIVDSGDGSPYDVALRIKYNGSTANPCLRIAPAITTGALYTFSFAFKKIDVNGECAIGTTIMGSQVKAWTNISDVAWATRTHTWTSSVNYAHVYMYAAAVSGTQNSLFDTFSLKRLTDCAATGALLLSTRGGSRGYVYKDAAFNPGLALTYKILYAGAD